MAPEILLMVLDCRACGRSAESPLPALSQPPAPSGLIVWHELARASRNQLQLPVGYRQLAVGYPIQAPGA